MPQIEKVPGSKGAKKADLNTVLDAAKKRAEELGIRSVVVASPEEKPGLRRRRCLEATMLWW